MRDQPFRRFGFCVVGVLAASTCFGQTSDEKTIERARELLKLFLDGKFEEFTARGDEKVRAQFTPELGKQALSSLQFQIGECESETSAKLSKIGDNVVVDFACRFTRGICTLRITLDPQGRMAGFFCTQLDADFAYELPAYVDQTRFAEEKVTVSAGEFPLKGTLTIPKDGGPHPAVVLVHGSGPHDEDETVGAHKPFRDLAWGLASRGVAVLRYVKRTKAHPTARARGEWTLDVETIDDALAAAQLAREHSRIDAERVFVAGHSLGAFAAPFIAERDEKLGGIIMLAGNARSILDLVAEQVEYIAKHDGDYSDKEREKTDALKKAIAAVRSGNAESVNERILGVPAKYWAHVHGFKNVDAAKRLKLPILIVQGGRDYQVTTEDFRIWKKALADRKNVTFKLFDDLNHLLVAGSGPSGPEEYQQPGHVAAQVIRDIAGWIHAH